MTAPRGPVPQWVTGALPDRSGMGAYVVLIRSPRDPARSPRPKGGRRDRAPHLALAKTVAGDWRRPILSLLEAAGEPLTFNSIGVRLLDKTADILFETPVEEALWSLVASGELEYTTGAPILFRPTKRPEGGRAADHRCRECGEPTGPSRQFCDEACMRDYYDLYDDQEGGDE